MAGTKKYKGLQGIRWQFVFSVFGINIVCLYLSLANPCLVSPLSLFSIIFWLNNYPLITVISASVESSKRAFNE